MFKTLFHHLAMVQCDPSSHCKMVLPISDWKSHGGGSLNAIGKMMNCPMQDKSGHVAGKHICRKHPLHVPTFASGFVSSIFSALAKIHNRHVTNMIIGNFVLSIYVASDSSFSLFLSLVLMVRTLREVALSLFLPKILIFSNCRNLWIKHFLVGN